MTSHSSSPIPFDPNTFLDLAYELASEEDELHLRAAIGRAYYALFLLARAKTGVYTKTDSHKAVHDAMEKHPKLVSAASQLRALFRMRKAADYDLIPDTEFQNWQENWKRAQHIIKRIHPRVK